MAKKLYVGNLPFSATEEEIRNSFSSYNPTSVTIITDRDTGRSRGFAFVEVEDSDRAIQEMNGADIGGRRLTVNEARERAPRTGGGGYDRGGRNDRSRDRW